MKRFFLILAIVAFTMVSFAETFDTGLLKNDQDYFSWLNGFTEKLKDFTMFQSNESEEAVQMALNVKPSGGGIYYLSWFKYFKKYIKDYSMFSNQDKYLKTAEYGLKAMPERNITGFYNEWFKTFNEYLKNYIMFENDKNKKCVDFLIKTAPKGGSDGDYKLWYDKYDYYMKQYQLFKDDKYKIACDMLVKVKPSDEISGDDNITLDFLKNIDDTAKKIIKNKANSKAFIKLIKAYKELLVNEAIQGNEWAKQDYNSLKEIF